MSQRNEANARLNLNNNASTFTVQLEESPNRVKNTIQLVTLP